MARSLTRWGVSSTVSSEAAGRNLWSSTAISRFAVLDRRTLVPCGATTVDASRSTTPPSGICTAMTRRGATRRGAAADAVAIERDDPTVIRAFREALHDEGELIGLEDDGLGDLLEGLVGSDFEAVSARSLDGPPREAERARAAVERDGERLRLVETAGCGGPLRGRRDVPCHERSVGRDGRRLSRLQIECALSLLHAGPTCPRCDAGPISRSRRRATHRGGPPPCRRGACR